MSLNLSFLEIIADTIIKYHLWAIKSVDSKMYTLDIT